MVHASSSRRWQLKNRLQRSKSFDHLERMPTVTETDPETSSSATDLSTPLALNATALPEVNRSPEKTEGIVTPISIPQLLKRRSQEDQEDFRRVVKKARTVKFTVTLEHLNDALEIMKDRCGEFIKSLKCSCKLIKTF